MPKDEDKPPIGIEPKWSWLEKRCRQLVGAINRYQESGNIYNEKVCLEWVIELKEVLEQLHKIRGIE